MFTATTTFGDMLDQRADVLVHGVSTDLLLGASALEETLRLPEYSDVLVMLNSVRNPPIGTIIVAPSGKLSAKHLLFAVTHSELTPPTDSSVAMCVVNCLERTEQLGGTIVALPALGARLCHYTMEEVARASLHAVQHYQETHPQTQLTRVQFVLPYETDLPVWDTARTTLALERDTPATPASPLTAGGTAASMNP